MVLALEIYSESGGHPPPFNKIIQNRVNDIIASNIPVPNMRPRLSENTLCLGSLGGLFMISGSDGSDPRAIAGDPSVARLMEPMAFAATVLYISCKKAGEK